MKRYWFGLALLALVALSTAPALYEIFSVRRANAQTNPESCRQTAIYDASTNGSTRLITGISTARTFICGYVLFAAGTVNVKFISGTGSVCATGSANLTPAFQFTAQTGISDSSSVPRGIILGPSTDFCLNTSGGVAVQSIVYFDQR